MVADLHGRLQGKTTKTSSLHRASTIGSMTNTLSLDTASCAYEREVSIGARSDAGSEVGTPRSDAGSVNGTLLQIPKATKNRADHSSGRGGKKKRNRNTCDMDKLE
jgi:hypothetical protein